SFINAQGFGKIGMLTVVIGAVLNIILDPIFIFVLDMGVKGAAIATIISQFVSSVWIMMFLCGKKTILRLQVRNFRLHRRRVSKIVTLGFSGFIMAITNSAVQIVSNTSLQFYGGDLYVGIMTVINSIREIITLPVTGFTNATQPVISYNYGARAYDRVRTSIKFMSVVCVLYTFIAWLILNIFPEFFIKIFNRNPELIKNALSSLRIYFLGFFMMPLQFAGQSTFVALGKSKQAIFFSLLRKVIIVIPLTILLPKMFGLGINGVFLAEPISNIIGGIACYATMIATVRPELKNQI
ncbi:MAG: MATE family efflux transporter, partial [Clostridiales bacterium]|nr:MATE family efflux transporter [Clostridiales bacterium]